MSRSCRWIACPGASLWAADVACPARGECPAQLSAMISACAFVTPSARAAATTARFTISAIEAAVIAAAPILPCRVTDRNTGPSVIPDRSIQARARRTLRGRHGPPHTAEPAKLVDDGFIAIPLMALPGRAPAGPAGNANGVSRGRLIGI